MQGNPSSQIVRGVPEYADTSASDLVDAIVGAPKVLLGGFSDRSACRGSWTSPATPFIPARHYDRAVPLIKASATNWKIVAISLSGLALAAVAFAAGVMTATAMTQWETSASEASPPWKMTQVLPTGVLVSMQGKSDLIPVGSRLPNGDVVVSVFPNRHVVVLETATVMLRSPDASKQGAQ